MFELFLETISKWNTIVGLIVVVFAFALLLMAKKIARYVVRKQYSKASQNQEVVVFDEQLKNENESNDDDENEQQSLQIDYSSNVIEPNFDENILETPEQKFKREKEEKFSTVTLVFKAIAGVLAIVGCAMVMFI